LKNIKNIIFDLGGVIINLDIKKTIEAFNRISHIRFEDIYTQAEQSHLFDLLDRGKISGEEFFRKLKEEIRYKGSDKELFFAWNAMIGDVPEKRLDLLVEAKQNYNTFLLSNTNELHIDMFEHGLYQRHGVKNFEDYFDKVYYSCRVGMRKPDKEIFEFVLEQNDLKPEETVFIDDSIQHVQGAGACGINAYLLSPNMEVGDLLKELKLL
jgi:putative hydrolase of the HAD superfamily